MDNGNEFSNMYNKDEFNNDTPDISNEQPEKQESNIVGGNQRGTLYDFTKASKNTKGPERIPMDGKEVIISNIKLIVPDEDTPWELSRNKKTQYKDCQFSVFYDDDGQKEYYSGVKVFERKVNNVSKYSEPSIRNEGTSQSTQLKLVYADFKGKKIEEVSNHEFWAFLSSKPKAILKIREYEFTDPDTNITTITKKNMVEKFI